MLLNERFLFGQRLLVYTKGITCARKENMKRLILSNVHSFGIDQGLSIHTSLFYFLRNFSSSAWASTSDTKTVNQQLRGQWNRLPQSKYLSSFQELNKLNTIYESSHCPQYHSNQTIFCGYWKHPHSSLNHQNSHRSCFSREKSHEPDRPIIFGKPRGTGTSNKCSTIKWVRPTFADQTQTQTQRTNEGSFLLTWYLHSKGFAKRTLKGPSHKPEWIGDTEMDSQRGKNIIKQDALKSMRPVRIAMICNGVIFTGKLAMFSVSGSSVMLAEAVHSLADLCNQYLLRVGILASQRAPDAKYNYGYSRERFVWSLISGVGIFCLGAGVNIVHGVHGILDPHLVDAILPSLGVLLLSGVMESYSFVVAYRHVKESAQTAEMKVWDFIKAGRDPTTVAILAEDGAAVAGLGMAGVCLTASHLTSSGIYDAVGSVLIGGLLGMAAVHLINANRHGLLGRSMQPEVTNEIMELLGRNTVVQGVYDLKTEEIGPGEFRFKAEIEFDGKEVVKNYLNRSGREGIYSALRAAALSPNDRTIDLVMMKYGEEIVTALGDEVDYIEKQIKEIEPRITHVDIETN